MRIDLEKLASEARKHQAKGKKNLYPMEFKRCTVAALEEVSEKVLISALGIAPMSLHNWKRQLSPSPSKARCLEAESSSISFAPVIPTGLEETGPKNPNQDGGVFRFEFCDPKGRRLSVTMPWDKSLASSLFHFISDTLRGEVMA